MVGVDIGGTFTDVAATEVGSRELRIAKVPSVPADPAQAVVNGLETLFETGIQPRDVRFFAHGTTVATNALLEGKGARAGLLITQGYNALYELRGGTRPTGSDLIDTFYLKPAALIPLQRTEEIPERVAFDGSVLEPLDEHSVRAAVRRLRDTGVESIAVMYLFSFMHPGHERRTEQIIHEEHPTCRVSLSSIVLPIIREYFRLSTTILDAYVGPVIARYLERLASHLRQLGLTTEQLYLMQSNGGLMRIDVAATYPNQTLLSGPAAGVVFGASIGQLSGEPNVVTFDMGGTSTDISVLPDNTFQETRRGKISGQDIGTPMIQISTLGAGGGTIAWIGPDGLLKAGPRSAGADPGPACYGLGGEEPTVTDANVVLGYLDPDYFVGGRLSIDPALSEKAIRQRVAEPLGLSVEEAALGIIRVVNVNMEVGLRLAVVERGLDHRKFALVAFGGAGPLHATRVARNVGIPRVVVPLYPGISCAMGLLQTDVKHYYLQSRLVPLTLFPLDELNAVYAELEQQAADEARVEGFDPRDLGIQRQLDLHYPYQGYELTVPVPSGALQEAQVQQVRSAFDALHLQVYGTSAPHEIPEVVNVRVVATSRVPKLSFQQLSAATADALRGHRCALFEETGEYVQTPIYERARLSPRSTVDGPAIIEQLDSTTVVLPGQRAVVDAYGTLVVHT
jgi:N-methylhydantoinase A